MPGKGGSTAVGGGNGGALERRIEPVVFEMLALWPEAELLSVGRADMGGNGGGREAGGITSVIMLRVATC